MSDQFHQQQLNQFRDREAEWFAKRMTITTKSGMLRQYQLEEQARGYKIQTLEFKSPAYILKNFIYTASHGPHRSLSGLRRLQGRNGIIALVGGTNYLLTQLFLASMQAPPARRVAMICAAMALLLAAATTAHLGQNLMAKSVASGTSQNLIITSSKVKHTRQSEARSTHALSSLQQKKFAREMHGTL